MANSVKSKFAGFLRGLINRADNRTPARPVAGNAPLSAPASAPASHTARGAHSPAPAAAAPVADNPDLIALPLTSVVSWLPMDLRAKVMTVPQANQIIHLQAEMVIGQLAFGAVKISFGELRRMSPGIFMNSGSELDSKLVTLPLQEILPRLNPALLARRTGRKIEVSEEIVGPFGEGARGVAFTTTPLKGPVSPPPPREPEPAPAHQPPISFTPPPAPRQVSPPAAPPIPPRSVTPAPSAGHGMPISPMSPPPARSVTPAHGTNGHTNGHGNNNGVNLPPGLRLASPNGNNQAPPPARPAAAPAPAPVPPAPAPAAPSSVPPQPMIFAPLNQLCESWPADLKDEIFGSPLANANVPLDGAAILPGLKRGRIVMTWRQIRIAIQPNSPPSQRDNTELELPLKVIAPLFLAAQKNPARPRAKTTVSVDIPDLFYGFQQPAAPAPAPAAAPKPAPAPAPAPAPMAPVVPPLPKPQEGKAGDTNYFTWGENGQAPTEEMESSRGSSQTDFLNRRTQPKDVVARAVTLPGVAGSVVAMQDGLRVASQTPPDLNADTLAAFLPQIFERLNASTRELRMGALNNINFTVGNVPWRIYRVNAVYFAAFGRAGEHLPSAQLAQLAAELDRKKQ